MIIAMTIIITTKIIIKLDHSPAVSASRGLHDLQQERSVTSEGRKGERRE